MSKDKKVKTEVKEKDPKLAIDPTVTQDQTKESEEVNAKAMKDKLANEAVVQKETNKMSAETQVNAKDEKRGVEVVESDDLKEAVAKDAKERKKTFTECPITGVLVVS